MRSATRLLWRIFGHHRAYEHPLDSPLLGHVTPPVDPERRLHVIKGAMARTDAEKALRGGMGPRVDDGG